MPKFKGTVMRRVVRYERAEVDLDTDNNIVARDQLHELVQDKDRVESLSFTTFRGPDADSYDIGVYPVMGEAGLSLGHGTEAPASVPPVIENAPAAPPPVPVAEVQPAADPAPTPEVAP